MRIALAQIGPVVGAFEDNVRKILDAHARASQAGARLLLTPELAVTGYPLLDLALRPDYLMRSETALLELARATTESSCAIAVGHLGAAPVGSVHPVQNRISVLQKGKIVFTQAKSCLPVYDVFDEARTFTPASEIQLWECDGVKIAFAICEDLWEEAPAKKYAALGADLILSASSSPYEQNKLKSRHQAHQRAVALTKAPLLYVNQAGANDEILFDGRSFGMSAKGDVLGQSPAFQAGIVALASFEKGALKWEGESSQESELSVLGEGLITGIREYFARTGFKTALVGLSGGMDSALVALLAAQALGPKHVLGLAMPSQYSSGHSLEDAEVLAKKLGIHFEVRPIKFLFSAASRDYAETRGELAPIALENLQSRLRALTVMTLANHYGALVLTTGNKSELACGYGTLYGDMVGALNPVGDIYKTQIYTLARHLNAAFGSPIPERTFTKAPSAELKPGQTDQDTLPPYDQLDAFLTDLIEGGLPRAELVTRHPKLDVVSLLKRVETNEFKRRQAPPILKVSTRAFGIGRRVPIARAWDV